MTRVLHLVSPVFVFASKKVKKCPSESTLTEDLMLICDLIYFNTQSRRPNGVRHRWNHQTQMHEMWVGGPPPVLQSSPRRLAEPATGLAPLQHVLSTTFRGKRQQLISTIKTILPDKYTINTHFQKKNK